jgi:hypothetical protein
MILCMIQTAGSGAWTTHDLHTRGTSADPVVTCTLQRLLWVAMYYLLLRWLILGYAEYLSTPRSTVTSQPVCTHAAPQSCVRDRIGAGVCEQCKRG